MEIDRNTMTEWVIGAVKELGGSGTILEISKEVWKTHGKEIKEAGDIFYTWQYELRWAGDILRKEGIPVLFHAHEETAYNGIFIPQKGWGAILVPEERVGQATDILSSLIKSFETE